MYSTRFIARSSARMMTMFGFPRAGGGGAATVDATAVLTLAGAFAPAPCEWPPRSQAVAAMARAVARHATRIMETLLIVECRSDVRPSRKKVAHQRFPS